MVTLRRLFVLLPLCLLSLSARAALISEATILANWTSDFSATVSSALGVNNNNNNWAQSGNTVINSGNRTGSLLSDFSATGNFSFSTRIRANGDNDLFGILFEVQDYNNNYSLTWGGGGVGSLNGIQLRRNDGTSSSTVLASQAGNWTSGTIYDLLASRSGNNLSVSVSQGATTLFSTTVSDASYTLGGVGFETYSQNTSFSFGATDFTGTAAPVPEPAPLALAFVGMLALLSRRRNRRATVA